VTRRVTTHKKTGAKRRRPAPATGATENPRGQAGPAGAPATEASGQKSRGRRRARTQPADGQAGGTRGVTDPVTLAHGDKGKRAIRPRSRRARTQPGDRQNSGTRGVTDPVRPAAGAAGPDSDRERAVMALEKQRHGGKPTRQEAAALRRWQARHEEEQRWKHYRSIPAKHWRAMAGRSDQVRNDQAGRYGIPFGGPTIDLTAVVRAWHDFLAANAVKLARDADPSSLEHWKAEHEKARARRAKVQADLAEQQAIFREVYEQDLDRICGAFRNAIARAPNELVGRVAGKTIPQIRKALTDWSERVQDALFGTPDRATWERMTKEETKGH